MENNWYRHAKSIGLDKVAQPIPGVAQATPTVTTDVTPSLAAVTDINTIMRSLIGHRGDFFKVVAQLLGIPNANMNSLLPTVQKNLAAITSSVPMMTDLLKALNVDAQKLTPAGMQLIGANLSQMCGTNSRQAANILLSLIGENARSFEAKAQQNYAILGSSPTTSTVQQAVERTVQTGV